MGTRPSDKMLTFSLKTTLTVATRNKGCHDAK